jgi:hypothetical protein
MNPSLHRRWLPRFALWAAVCGLLLRAAVPLFAVGAAHLRGVPVAEVCTVYGVAMPAASDSMLADQAHHHDEHSGQQDYGSHSAAVHTGDHCALTALAALAAPESPTHAISAAHVATPALHSERGTVFRDRCAIWVARLKHGPPAVA